MFVILTNRVDQKQATAAENKLFCLKKYVPRNYFTRLANSLEHYQSIFRSPTLVWTGENYAYHCHPKKRNKKHILVIWLVEQHKDIDRSGKKSPNLTKLLLILAAFIDIHKGHVWGDWFQMCHGKISKQA